MKSKQHRAGKVTISQRSRCFRTCSYTGSSAWQLSATAGSSSSSTAAEGLLPLLLAKLSSYSRVTAALLSSLSLSFVSLRAQRGNTRSRKKPVKAFSPSVHQEFKVHVLCSLATTTLAGMEIIANFILWQKREFSLLLHYICRIRFSTFFELTCLNILENNRQSIRYFVHQLQNSYAFMPLFAYIYKRV